MKKNIIISLALLLLIVMIGMCACSRGHMYSEGFAGTGTPETVPLSGTPLDSLAKDAATFDNIKLLSNTTDTLVAGKYVAFIDAATGSLKIAKVTSATSGDVIWDSAKSNPLWKAAAPIAGELKLTSGGSLSSYTTQLILGSVPIVNITTTTQANNLTMIDGDLVIKDASTPPKVLWSLLDSELQTAKAAVNAYVGSTSNITNAVGRPALIDKLQNLDNYIKALPASTETDLAVQKTMAELRRQMDFEIGELNGKNGSKLAVSTNTLQSTMYLNLGITVLAASLFVLIVTR
jgi:hypothetical protein